MTLAHGGAPAVWAWRPHPDIWLTVLLLPIVYLWAIRRFGPGHVSPGEEPVKRSQMAAFMLGVVTLWIASDWPIHDLAEDFLFSVHMVQHLLMSLVVTPLLILGMPEWMWRMLLSPPFIKGPFRRATRPVMALAISNGYLIFSHWPTFVDGVLASEPLHALAHVALIATSVIMWWPVLSPLAEIPRLGPAGQMFYLFLQTIVPTVPASFLTFADSAFYQTYVDAPRLAGMSALEDQRIAGLIMKLVGGFYLWTVIAVLFFRWSSREDQGLPDPAELQGIERELNRTKVN